MLDAARAALGREILGYTDASGLPALREAIAMHYRAFYGVALDPARVVVTTGSSAGFILAFLAAFDPGDRVALAAPAYPAYRNILLALDLVPVELPAGPDTRFQATLDLLRSHKDGVDGLIVASPANPTGSMLAGEELAAVARHCEEQGIRLISDEIYHGISYGKVAATAAATSAEAIIVNSFSKYYSMTGWRIGWMVVPEAMLRTIECLAQNLYISAPTLSQHAALAAFSCGDELDRNVARYAANRAVLLDELPKAGFDQLRARGRRLLSLCRRRAADQRQHGILPPHAARDRYRRHARRRFRSDARSCDPALLLCRLDRRDRRSRAAHQELETLGQGTNHIRTGSLPRSRLRSPRHWNGLSGQRL